MKGKHGSKQCPPDNSELIRDLNDQIRENLTRTNVSEEDTNIANDARDVPAAEQSRSLRNNKDQASSLPEGLK